MFGVASSRPMPKATIALFGARDLLCVGSAFTLPPMLAAGLASSGIEKRRADDAAQLISPVGMQLFCAPLHLLGLNFYNMPIAAVGERAAAVARTAPQTIVAFALRMAPAFGVGGVLNASLTSAGRDAVREHYAGMTATTTPGAVLTTAATGATLARAATGATLPLPTRDRAFTS